MELDPMITAYKIDEDGATANNVLAFAIGELTDVSICGRRKDGTYYYASSMDSPKRILKDLKAFSNLMKEYRDQ